MRSKIKRWVNEFFRKRYENVLDVKERNEHYNRLDRLTKSFLWECAMSARHRRRILELEEEIDKFRAELEAAKDEDKRR